MKLAVISHTEHYIAPDGQIVGWGPTIREINHLLEIFEEIWHVAVLHGGPAPPSALPYISDKIHFVPLKPFGGSRFKDKLGILKQIPSVIRTVNRVLKQVDWWQFRAPTGIGVFLIPYLSWFVTKPGWFKYAGNWAQINPPMGYGWQRLLLSSFTKKKVTINGFLPGQNPHLISFENPCLTKEERQVGRKTLKIKSFKGPLDLCFVGRLEDAKGIRLILENLQLTVVRDRINCMHIVGNGPNFKDYQTIANNLALPILFYGWMNREHLTDIFSKCHLILLPTSASEGFPKVLAEAANFGCVPAVSNISSIPDYISDKNGFVWTPAAESFADFFTRILSDKAPLQEKAYQAYEFAEDFTYEFYINKLKTKILTRSIQKSSF